MSRPVRAADRTTLPNRLKRLHAVVAAAPAKFGFPSWVSRLPVKGRRISQKKLSGAKGRFIRRAARDLQIEADQIGQRIKVSDAPRR
jgi:hypothetical protein